MATRTCPACRKVMSAHIFNCPHCGQPVEPLTAEQLEARAKANRIVKFVGLGLVVVFVGWCSVATANNMSKSGNVYGSVTNVRAVGTAQVDFTLTVANGNESGVDVTCSVQVGDGAYRGYDWFDVGWVPANDSTSVTGSLTVANNGAQFVYDGTADCKSGG